MTRILTLSLAASLLAGCATMEPRYARPYQTVSEEFPRGPAYPVRGSSEPWADIGWNDFFADPRLKSLIQNALVNNRDLRVAIANIDKARAQYRIQKSALIPTINGDADAGFGRTSANSSPTGVRSSQESYSLSVGVTSYEVDLWGRIRSLNKESLELYLATDAAARATQISLISEVASAWLAYAADQSRLSVARATLASAQRSNDIAQKRFRGGIASKLDASQSATLVEQSRGRIAELVTLVAQDENALRLLVGAPIDTTLLPRSLDDRIANREALPANLDSRVLISRPDVIAAERRLRAANYNIGAARAALFPTISLTGAAGLQSTSLANLVGAGSTFWSFLPSISLPFLDGGRRKAELDVSRADKTIQVATYEKAVQTAFREVSDALARRGTVDEQLASAVAQVAVARDALRLSRLRYEGGIDTYFNVLDAQRTLFTAEQNLVDVRQIRGNNLVTLYQVLGGGLKP